MSMIEVKRNDYEARTICFRNGKKIEIPKHHIIKYYFGNREVAMYDSREDVFGVRTEYIHKNFSMGVFDRAVRGKFGEAFSYLFTMLNIDEETAISEYMSM